MLQQSRTQTLKVEYETTTALPLGTLTLSYYKLLNQITSLLTFSARQDRLRAVSLALMQIRSAPPSQKFSLYTPG